jgi:hypothetical protein
MNVFDDWPFDSQCVVRFPPEIAERLHEVYAHTNPGEGMPIQFTAGEDRSGRHFNVTFQESVFGKQYENLYAAVLVDLPCYTETRKTLDMVHVVRSADLSQMLLVYNKEEEQKTAKTSKSGVTRTILQRLAARDYKWPDGLTSATKKVAKRRWARPPPFSKQELSDASNALRKAAEGKELIFEQEDVCPTNDALEHQASLMSKAEKQIFANRDERLQQSELLWLPPEERTPQLHDMLSQWDDPATTKRDTRAGSAAGASKTDKRAVRAALAGLRDDDDTPEDSSGVGEGNLPEASASASAASKPQTLWEWKKYN